MITNITCSECGGPLPQNKDFFCDFKCSWKYLVREYGEQDCSLREWADNNPSIVIAGENCEAL